MNRIFNITLKAAAAILAVILAASCVFEKENPVSKQQKQNVLVQIGVSTDGMAQTKADVINKDANGNDLTEGGAGVETTISTLRLYAYIGNVLSGYAYVPEYSATDKIYMDLKNLPSSGTQQVEFVAVANEGSMTGINGINIEVGKNPDGTIRLPSNFGRNSFGGIKYTIANQGFTAKVDEKETVVGMPMYATKTVTIDVDKVGDPNTADGHNGHFILQEAVNLTLTRSLAKIEVYAAEDAGLGTSGSSNAGIQITGVELMNVIADGPLFPAEASTDILTTNPKLDGKAVALSASATDKADPAKYTKITNAYYLAENDYGVDGEFYYGDDLDAIATTDNLKAATTLKIGYKVGNSDKTGYVIMPQIERNTCYKVLARITAGGQMTLTFVAQPWNLIEETLTYDDNVSVTEGKINWSAEPNGNAEVVTTGNDLSCEFTIATPSYATWHASFIPLEGDQNAFGFVTTDENLNVVTVPTFSGPVGSPAKLTIRPLVQNPMQTNKARLRIIVRTNEGRTIVVKNNILSGNNYNNDEYILIHSM